MSNDKWVGVVIDKMKERKKRFLDAWSSYPTGTPKAEYWLGRIEEIDFAIRLIRRTTKLQPPK